MLHKFEDPVTKAVFAGKKVRKFSVTPDYSVKRHSGGDLTAAKAAVAQATTTAEQKRRTAVYDVMVEEQLIPTVVNCSAVIDDSKLDVPVDNTSTVGWQKYEVAP